MPRIDDDQIYGIKSLTEGCTWIGTNAEGNTVQFNYAGLVEAVKTEADIVFWERAKRIGQFVVGNLPDENGGILDGTDAPGFNGGMPFLAVLKAYPPVADNSDNLHYILQQV